MTTHSNILPGKAHGQRRLRSLVSCSPWGCKRARHNLATSSTGVIYEIQNIAESKPITSSNFQTSTLLVRYVPGIGATTNFAFRFTVGSDFGVVILKLFYMSCRIKQISKYQCCSEPKFSPWEKENTNMKQGRVKKTSVKFEIKVSE